jgi:hypothetical protein
MEAQIEVAYLFGLPDAPLQAVERASIQCIPNPFLDLGREDDHFQFRPDHSYLARATTTQTVIDQESHNLTD